LLLHSARRAAYESSVARCRHGHSGHVIVKLHDTIESLSYLEALKARAREGDSRMHAFQHAARAVAASLTKESLEDVFHDEHVHSVHADCLHRLKLPVMAKMLSPRGAPQRLTQQGPQGVATEKDAAAAKKKLADTPIAAWTANAASDTEGVEERDVSAKEYWNWGLDRIDSFKGRDDKYVFGLATGSGTRLYHLDTGVYTAHEDFSGRAVAGFSVGCPTGYEKGCGSMWLKGGVITDEALEGPALAEDGSACDGHGTHTASTAAGTTYGVAKNATIVVVQALNCKGEAADRELLHAFEWTVTDHKQQAGVVPAVVTLSLGGSYSEVLNDAARQVADSGMVVVTAAGNEAADACQTSPASEPSSITVGAIDSDDRWAVYSNWGQCVTLFAPGSDITAAYPQKGYHTSAAILSGTSMATPHVAGAALQILQSHPAFSHDDVKRSMLCMATQNAIAGLDPYSPNRLLHTGFALEDEHNSKLVSQQHFDAEAEEAAEHAGGLGYTSFTGYTSANSTKMTPPANTCHLMEGQQVTANGYGPSTGYVVPEAQRVDGDVTHANVDDTAAVLSKLAQKVLAAEGNVAKSPTLKAPSKAHAHTAALQPGSD